MALSTRFNSATVDVSEIRVEDTADFALKLFSTVNLMRKNNKAGTYVRKRAYFAAISSHYSSMYRTINTHDAAAAARNTSWRITF